MRADEVPGLYVNLTFPEPLPDRPYIYLNMVMSLDGKATLEGTERGLGSPRDQRLMCELRLHADMVLNGANTLRISGSSASLRYEDLKALRVARRGDSAPLAATITRSADLPLDSAFFTAREFDAVVFITEGAPPERIAAVQRSGRRIVLLPDAPCTLDRMTRIMRQDLGVRYLLVEGGPTLNAGLFAHGLVDELFLTLAGKIVGGSASVSIVAGEPFLVPALPQLAAISSYYNEDDREFYFRWRVLR